MINEIEFKKKLIELGITQSQLAEKAGMTTSQVNNIIKGKSSPTIKTISNLCNVMGITESEEKVKIFLN